jgi:copper transport protein
LEAAVGILVLAVTTVLTGTEPARNQTAGMASMTSAAAPARATRLAIPFDTGEAGGRGRGTVRVTLGPARLGANSLKAVVLDSRQTVERVAELDIAFTLPARDMGPLKAVLKRSGNTWLGQGFQLPMNGSWRLSVTVRTSAIDEVTQTRTVWIPEKGR